MSLTEPLYSLPIVVAGTETITVDMNAGAGDFVATLTAGTYYNHLTSSGSFAAMIVDVLNTADTGTPWALAVPSTGLSFRLSLVRTGTTPDEMTSFTFSDDAIRRACGFSALAITAGTELANDDPTTDDTTLTGSFQRGYMWLPRTLLGIDERVPISEVAGSVTAQGRAVVDGYGEYERIRHVIEFVPGPLVYTDKAADTDFAGVQVTGMATGDDCAPLDQFWTLCRTGANGAPPVIKYVPDSTDTATTEDIVIADLAWLQDMDNVAEETSKSPLLYRVRINAMESVTSSFTYTGPTIGDATVEIPEVDTRGDLPTGQAEGTLRMVTTTGAQGVWAYMATLDDGGATTHTVDKWFPINIYRRINGWLENGSNNPVLINTVSAGGTDTKSALTSRGWADASASPGSVADVSDTIEFDATTLNKFGRLTFASVVYPAAELFVVWEIDDLAGTTYNAAELEISDNSTSNARTKLTGSYAGATNKNRFSCVQSASVDVGTGYIEQTTAFKTVFGIVQCGTTTTPMSDETKFWAADDGNVPLSSCRSKLGNYQTASANEVRVTSGTGAGSTPAKMQVQTLMIFTLSVA
jgi:hypothetical protein